MAAGCLAFGLDEGMSTLIDSLNDSVSYQYEYGSLGRAAIDQKSSLKKDVIGELYFCVGIMLNTLLHGDNDVFYLDEEANRLMMTGDLAKMDDLRAVHVLGRYMCLIIRADKDLSPALIEASSNKF